MARSFKPLGFAGVLALFGGGRFFYLYVVKLTTIAVALEWAIVYGIVVALIFYHIVDIFLARGLIQSKIVAVRALFLYFIVLILCNSYLLQVNTATSGIVFFAEAAVTVIVAIWSILVDYRLSGSSDHVVASDATFPSRYVGRRYARTFFESFFRLFPRPEPVGLYEIGNPNSDSMVIVTGNYDLTIRRVARALAGRDCWLLVCDSRGINIWCSTLANHFNTEKIVNAIMRFDLGKRVTHRRLILPQLCAANVSLPAIREQTGFIGRFGPIRIEDIGAYLSHSGGREIRTVSFPLKRRLEMAAGTLFLPSVLAVFVFNFIDPHMLFVVLPAAYVMSFLNAAVFPYRFITNVRAWSIAFSLAVSFVTFVFCTYLLRIPAVVYTVTVGVAILYLVNEFEGWSPLVKFSVSSAYAKARIHIDPEKCTGCRACLDVCPKGVYAFEHRKAVVARLDECISCKSCFVQCTAGAIDHSAQAINEAFV